MTDDKAFEAWWDTVKEGDLYHVHTEEARIIWQAALAYERAKQAEPVATVVGTSDLEGRVQWRQSQRVELGTKLYTSPPAVQVDSEFCNKCGRIHNLPIEVLARSSADDVAWGIDCGRSGDQTAVSIIKKLPDGSIEVVATEYGPPADDEG